MTANVMKSLPVLLIGSALAACASAPKLTPSDAVQQAGMTLESAREHHVDDYDAPELRIARTKYAAAQKALLSDKPEQARPLAQEVEISVKLATIRAAGARAKANEKALQRQIDSMEHLANPSDDTTGDAQ